jgi:phytol kinase
MAALIGKRFGKHTFVHLGNKRSIEGSLAMFATSMMIILSILTIDHGMRPHDLVVAIPTAAIAALLEAYSPGGTDNLSVPLSSAFLSYALQSVLS